MIRISALALAFALVLGAASHGWSDEGGGGESKPGTDPKVEYDGLLYLGLNDRGAEEWHRIVDGAVVIRVPRGEYMQRPYEGTGTSMEPKPVAVESFFLDKHEVTNAQFAKFLSAMEAVFEGGALERRLVRWIGKRPRDLLRRPDQRTQWVPAAGRGRHPVVDATGWGALAYAYWAGGRMPTQIEWEKAAGGPKGLLYPWGKGAPDSERANFARPKPRGTAAVGSSAKGAGPYGHLDMAGNAYDRVMTRGRDGRPLPTMLKGGSWLTPHPLNLRVLDMCMQPMGVADRSVGFRVAMDDPQPARPMKRAQSGAVLRLAKDFQDAVEEAEQRGVPIFLSLQYDTCGQCDRMRVQLFRDRRFIAYCNQHLVVIVGHHPGDAGRDPHPKNEDGTCPFYPGLECYEHHLIFQQARRVVGDFVVSPGNFVLDPDRMRPGAGEKAILVGERDLPKWGGGVETYLEAFERARKELAERASKSNEAK